MKPPKSVKTLEEFGRVQLSKSFFMRDFLYSEISQIEGIPNIPDYPDIAIEAGKGLCENVLEPIQDSLGRICIRSAYRSCAVNARGAENKNHSISMPTGHGIAITPWKGAKLSFIEGKLES